MATGEAPRLMGVPMKRREDPRLITGQGKFTDDVNLERTAYMEVLRSVHANARIRGVDVSAALGEPEVLAVLTGDQVLRRCSAPLPMAEPTKGINAKTRWPLSTDRVRFVGDAIAAVVATSRAAAKDALELIEVDYEPLPATVDLEKSAEEGSPLVHEDLGTNLCVASSGSVGDPDGAFREADGVVSARFAEPRVVVNPMEPRAVVASYDQDSGQLTLWDTTQAHHLEREEVSQVLGIPEARVRVIGFDVGGGFGAKHPVYPETYLAALFAMDLDRPVKWVEDRQEHFLATIQGRGHVQHVEAAYRKDGTILGIRAVYYADIGAYCVGSAHSLVDTMLPTVAPGMYMVDNLAWTSYGVYTNKPPYGPYRGYNKAEPTYMLERVVDLIARDLGMDAAEVRRKNFIPRDAFPYKTATGLEYDSGDYEAALDRALELAEYNQLKDEQRRLRAEGILMGVGIATNVELSSFGPSSKFGISTPGYVGATVKVGPEGKLTVFSGCSPHGQGHETTYTQIMSDEMDVPFDDVEIVYGDTAVTPHGGLGTAATRSLVIGGTAMIKAGEAVKAKATQIAAGLLQIDPEHVLLESGRFFAEDIPGRHVTWAEVERAASQTSSEALEATAYWEPPNYTFPFAAQLAVVLVDGDTGEVTLTKHVCVDDSGNVINPMVVEGQVHGGLAQGIGTALLEEAVWDESGQLVTGSFMDYAMPLAEGLPMFSLDRTVTPSPTNPMGAKGGGETGILAAAPAIVNAVVDALSHLGVEDMDMPVTSERVWRVLKEKGATG